MTARVLLGFLFACDFMIGITLDYMTKEQEGIPLSSVYESEAPLGLGLSGPDLLKRPRRAGKFCLPSLSEQLR